jgi:hypothetical protein
MPAIVPTFPRVAYIFTVRSLSGYDPAITKTYEVIEQIFAVSNNSIGLTRN